PSGSAKIRELYAALPASRGPPVWKRDGASDRFATELLQVAERPFEIVHLHEDGHVAGALLGWSDPAADALRGGVHHAVGAAGCDFRALPSEEARVKRL